MTAQSSKIRSLLVGILACGFVGIAGNAEEAHHDCVENVPEYAGINAVPPVTLQILPSAHGDTVLNDAEHPPGAGPQVVVGYWEFTGEPAKGENPCAGEPLAKIAYPVDFGPKCFAWKHWIKVKVEGDKDDDASASGVELHENSAQNFACGENGEFKLDQWVDTMTCENPNRQPKAKTAFRTKCCKDTPSPGEGLPALYSQLLSGCGKEPPAPR